MQKIFTSIVSFFTSPRFLSVVGHCLAIGAIAALNDFSAHISSLSLPTWAVTVIGVGIAQIIAAFNNEGVVAGFSGK